jgi:sugar transferase (PEP-CTERM/EpsH1 system associated)
MSKIHVVHIVFNFSTGGLENGLVNIINHLPKEKFQHSIICLKSYDKVFFERIKNTETMIYALNKPSGKSIRYFVQLFKLLRVIKPDIVHTRNLTSLECQIVAFLAGIKRRIHGEHGWDSPQARNHNKSKKIRKLLSFFVRRYVALSLEGCLYLQNEINIKKEEISHICNGVDINRFQPMVNTQSKIQLEVLTVGRLATVKNQILLLKGLANVIKQNKNINVTIVGEGACRRQLEEYVDTHHLQGHCQLLGDRTDIPTLMQKADVFVLPSLAEGISNTILEAMATGLPVVATNVGGNPELVCPSKNGELFESNSPEELSQILLEYLANAERIRAQGSSSREMAVNQFSINTMAEKYKELYLNIMR